MKLFILRHGETIENSKGIVQGHLPGKLSEKGILQAQKAGERLKKHNFTGIFSSDLYRAKETTKQIIVYHKNTPVIYTKNLREIDMGINQGKTKKELKWKSVLTRKYITPKKGESTKKLYDRCLKYLKYLIFNFENNILIITHSGTIKAFIAILKGIPEDKIFSVENIKNTSLSIFKVSNNLKSETLLFNNIDHLIF